MNNILGANLQDNLDKVIVKEFKYRIHAECLNFKTLKMGKYSNELYWLFQNNFWNLLSIEVKWELKNENK